MADVAGVAVAVRRICSECEHGALSTGGVFCTLFREEVVTERVAEECEDYKPVPWAQGGASALRREST